MICKINNIFLTLEKDDNFVFNIELKLKDGFYIQATLNPNKIPIILKQLNIKNYNEIKNKYVEIKPENIGLCQEVEQINFNGKWLKVENHKHFGNDNVSNTQIQELDEANQIMEDLLYQIKEALNEAKMILIDELLTDDLITYEKAEEFINKYMYPNITIEKTDLGKPKNIVCCYKFKDIDEMLRIMKVDEEIIQRVNRGDI